MMSTRSHGLPINSRLSVAGRRGAVALAAALALALLPVGSPAARASSPTSDIPGVPLPGVIVTNHLGGAIYDVVYSIDVPAGNVVIAGLTGSPGTDFDLYLFDSSATTVVNNVGVVASSTGPTSTEHLSYPVREAGRYYIDLNGATNVEGTFTLTVQIVPDPTPPIASVVLAGGRSVVNAPTVAVDVQAYDDLSGVPQMAFSANGTTWTSWQPLAFHTTWTFPNGDGLKTLWAKVRNGVGLESLPASATVRLDTVAPAVVSAVPVAGSRVSGLRPTFEVRFDKEVDPASWVRLGLIVQSATGVLVDGAYTMDPGHRIGRFVPSADLTPGVGYVVTVGLVADLAGNVVAPTGSWVVTAVLPTGLSLRASPVVVAGMGSGSVLSAVFTGPDSDPVLSLLAQLAGATAFTLVDRAQPGPDGVARFAVQPTSSTVYRVAYDGSPTIAAASADVRVLVRRGIRLAALGTTLGASRVGRSVTLQASIDPAAAGVSVSFRLYRYDPVRRTYRYAGSWGRGTSAEGRASYVWTPVSAGVYRWRAVVSSTVAFANNLTAPLGWTVGR